MTKLFLLTLVSLLMACSSLKHRTPSSTPENVFTGEGIHYSEKALDASDTSGVMMEAALDAWHKCKEKYIFCSIKNFQLNAAQKEYEGNSYPKKFVMKYSAIAHGYVKKGERSLDFKPEQIFESSGAIASSQKITDLNKDSATFNAMTRALGNCYSAGYDVCMYHDSQTTEDSLRYVEAAGSTQYIYSAKATVLGMMTNLK